jgi:hypothetical protein
VGAALHCCPHDLPLVLGIGVVNRWRWTFWLVLVALVLGGLLRVPASALQLAGMLPAQGPDWYTLLQAILGVARVAIGLAMLAGYQREGVWGSFLGARVGLQPGDSFATLTGCGVLC